MVQRIQQKIDSTDLAQEVPPTVEIVHLEEVVTMVRRHKCKNKKVLRKFFGGLFCFIPISDEGLSQYPDKQTENLHRAIVLARHKNY